MMQADAMGGPRPLPIRSRESEAYFVARTLGRLPRPARSGTPRAAGRGVCAPNGPMGAEHE